ncbi:MAG: hypothetical protein LBJ35_04655 [Spirochaetaceae bacterium]|jgi:hypothetical protein|nr:hypothetical protein [Spirochaetaceae bacterium]
MKRVCFLLLALFLALNTAFTQTKSVIFAPFVSGLRADINGRQVRLSWADSESVKGPVYIYRSVQPYRNTGEETVGQTAEVAYGAQIYTDNVPADGIWYYFVVASDQELQKYSLPLPFNNIVDVDINSERDRYGPVSSSGTQVTPEPYQQAYGNARPQSYPPPFNGIIQTPARGSISGITAVPIGKGIEIKFNAADTSKSAILYRNIQPLRSFSDLLTSTVVALNIRSPYMDYVTPGVPYYYAILYEDDIRTGRGEIIPGGNATFIPSEVSSNQTPPAETYTSNPAVNTIPAAGAAAPAAVPNNNTAAGTAGAYSAPNRDASGNIYVRPSQNSNTTDAYQSYRPYSYQSENTQILREPRVFNRDMQISSDIDDQRLAQIIQGPFMWRDWPAARDRLTEFIVDAVNNTAAERARFYLAQCWYFIGDMRMALSTFLKLQQIYPDETAIWIQASLNKLAEY